MEITIFINGRATSVQVSVEVYDYLNKANHKDENLCHEQRRHWDGRELNDAIISRECSRIYYETPEQWLCRKETLAEIVVVLSRCTAIQRERFLRYALDGWSIQQIATRHGCSKAAVHCSIEAVRKKFKKSATKRLNETPFLG